MSSDADAADGSQERRSRWEDPAIPAAGRSAVGNSPPVSRRQTAPYWFLAVSGLAWAAWVVFLIVMLP